MISLCEEHVTTTSAYQIFEVVFFVSSIVFFVEVKKMWRQAVFGKMSKSSHFFPWWEIYYLFKTRWPTKFPPGDGAYSGIHQNILVEAVLRPHINVLVDKHTPVFLFMQAWSTFWKNSHIVIAGTVPDALHCTIGLWVRTGVTNACWIHLQLDWVPSSYFGNSGVSLMLQKHNQEENNF